MGISVHRIDTQLDHGALLGVETVPVREGDDPGALMERAYAVDYRVVDRVVRGIALGTARAIQVELRGSKVLPYPSLAQLRELRARLGRPILVDDSRRARIPPLSDPGP